MQSSSDQEVIHHPDGRVELRDYATITSSPLYNKDLAPVPVARRKQGEEVAPCRS